MSLSFANLADLEKRIVSSSPVEIPGEMSSWLQRWKRLYIGGAGVDGASGETFRTLNPATGEELSEVCLAKRADVERAVERARIAFEAGSWSKRAIKERASVLHRIGDLILKHRAPLAILESLDTGKPIRESFDGDIPRAARNFHFFADFGL